MAKSTRTPEQTQRYEANRNARLDSLPKIPCLCGCGTMIPPINKNRQPGRYVVGHNPPNLATLFQPGEVPAWRLDPVKNAAARAKGAAARRGRKVPPEAIAKRTATRLARNGGTYYAEGRSPAERRDPTSWREKTAASIQSRDVRGEKNPFFGKTHPPEMVARIAERNSGENNHGWKGGVGTLPYGPEFTRKFKRLIRERDGNRCRRCGISREDHGRTLDVHHLDHDKFNNDPANLATSCKSCNVWAHWHPTKPWLPE